MFDWRTLFTHGSVPRRSARFSFFIAKLGLWKMSVCRAAAERCATVSAFQHVFFSSNFQNYLTRFRLSLVVWPFRPDPFNSSVGIARKTVGHVLAMTILNLYGRRERDWRSSGLFRQIHPKPFADLLRISSKLFSNTR